MPEQLTSIVCTFSPGINASKAGPGGNAGVACPGAAQRFQMARHMMADGDVQSLKIGPQPALLVQIPEERRELHRLAGHQAHVRVVEQVESVVAQHQARRSARSTGSG